MAIRPMIADDQGVDRVFGLVAGAPNIGKTTCLTHFPIDQMLGISVEKGFLSIKGSGYHFLEIDTYDDLIEILTVTLLTPAYAWVKYLFIDSLAEIYDLLKHEMKEKYTVKQNFAKNDDIKDMVFHAVRLTKAMMDKTVYWTCHTKEDKNGMLLEEELSFDGKMPGDLKKQFDTVLHMKAVQFEGQQAPQRVFITNPIVSKVAKKRVSPWLNIQVEDYENPDLYQLTNKLLGRTA